MPLALLLVYAFLLLKLGLASALEIMAIVGTLGAVAVGIIKWSMKPKRDRYRDFHSPSNGRYITKSSGYYGYLTAISALILPFAMKPDLLSSALPVFTNLPTEVQAVYVLVTHGTGYMLSR